MCEVFSARDLRRVECGDSRPIVAVKRLLPDMAQNRQAQLALAQEFFTLRHLVHPGVVRVFDLHREEWGLCFSMELLDGSSAYDMLGGNPVGLGRQGATAGSKIFETLDYLHSHGVAHGDIKPSNIFLEQEGRVVILDFNVALVNARPGAANAAASHGLRKALRIPGYSLLHASPESLEGAPPSPSGDVFSACCTVYEMLAGAHPFKMLPANKAAAQSVVPARPPFLGRRQWQWLRRGLSFVPQERPSSGQLCSAFGERRWFANLAFSLLLR